MFGDVGRVDAWGREIGDAWPDAKSGKRGRDVGDVGDVGM